jgi:hypothetical protein
MNTLEENLQFAVREEPISLDQSSLSEVQSLLSDSIRTLGEKTYSGSGLITGIPLGRFVFAVAPESKQIVFAGFHCKQVYVIEGSFEEVDGLAGFAGSQIKNIINQFDTNVA